MVAQHVLSSSAAGGVGAEVPYWSESPLTTYTSQRSSPGPRTQTLSEDWKLTDPAGQPLSVVREVRDEIRQHVARLLDDLT
ncbi:hypothetical protein [Micromonospora sp. WMMD708]|uniref:hypothetical protein n=1 Tax=Micromonospora sp. WMMD708 TaxID=3403464 RepID=UPI003BF5A663